MLVCATCNGFPESESWPDLFRPPGPRLETICILPVVLGRVWAQTGIEATYLVSPSSVLDLLSPSPLSLEGHPYRGAQEAHA
jgi:hypothetical protein